MRYGGGGDFLLYMKITDPRGNRQAVPIPKDRITHNLSLKGLCDDCQ